MLDFAKNAFCLWAARLLVHYVARKYLDWLILCLFNMKDFNSMPETNAFALNVLLLIVLTAFPYAWYHDLLQAFVCKNSGTLDWLFFKCNCVPHYDDGYDCSYCSIPKDRGECRFSATSKLGSKAHCRNKYYGTTCELCNANGTQCEGDRVENYYCLLYTSPSPRDDELSRMPSSA